MINKLAMINSCELLLKNKDKFFCQKSLWNSGAHYTCMHIILDKIQYLLSFLQNFFSSPVTKRTTKLELVLGKPFHQVRGFESSPDGTEWSREKTANWGHIVQRFSVWVDFCGILVNLAKHLCFNDHLGPYSQHFIFFET